MRRRLDEENLKLEKVEENLRSTISVKEKLEKEIEILQKTLKERNQNDERSGKEAKKLLEQIEELKNRIKSIEIESKEKLDKTIEDLTEKWSRKVKSDGEKIRKDLTEEKRKALEKMESEKQKEIVRLEKQIEQLERKVEKFLVFLPEKKNFSFLFELNESEEKVRNENQKSKEESLAALQNANEDKKRTINEFQMKIQDLNREIQRIETKSKEDFVSLKLTLEKENLVKRRKYFFSVRLFSSLQNQINDLKSRHFDDIRAQQLAHNTHLETIRADHERALHVETEKQQLQHQSSLGSSRMKNKIFHFSLLTELISF